MSTPSRYARLLRLRHLAPSPWQRALFVEGALLAAAVLVLADLASAWLLLAAPLAVAVAVKFLDAITGTLNTSRAASDATTAPGPEGPDAAEEQG